MSGLITIERPTFQKNIDILLSARGIEDDWPYCSIPLHVMNFLNKAVVLHKHKIIAVGTELPSTFFTPKIDDKKEAPSVNKTARVDEQNGGLRLLSIKNIVKRRKLPQKSQKYRQNLKIQNIEEAFLPKTFIGEIPWRLRQNAIIVWFNVGSQLRTEYNAKCWIKLTIIDIYRIHSAPYRDGPKAQTFWKNVNQVHAGDEGQWASTYELHQSCLNCEKIIRYRSVGTIWSWTKRLYGTLPTTENGWVQSFRADKIMLSTLGKNTSYWRNQYCWGRPR